MNRRDFAKLLGFSAIAAPFAGVIARLFGPRPTAPTVTTGTLLMGGGGSGGTGSTVVTGLGFQPQAVLLFPPGGKLVSFDENGFTLNIDDREIRAYKAGRGWSLLPSGEGVFLDGENKPIGS